MCVANMCFVYFTRKVFQECNIFSVPRAKMCDKSIHMEHLWQETATCTDLQSPICGTLLREKSIVVFHKQHKSWGDHTH